MGREPRYLRYGDISQKNWKIWNTKETIGKFGFINFINQNTRWGEWQGKCQTQSEAGFYIYMDTDCMKSSSFSWISKKKMRGTSVSDQCMKRYSTQLVTTDMNTETRYDTPSHTYTHVDTHTHTPILCVCGHIESRLLGQHICWHDLFFRQTSVKHNTSTKGAQPVCFGMNWVTRNCTHPHHHHRE